METFANAVMVFHWLVVAMLLGGVVLTAFFRWYRPIHVAILGTLFLSQTLFLICPLTTLEKGLRNADADGSGTWEGGFIVHYFEAWFGAAPPTIAITVIHYLNQQ